MSYYTRTKKEFKQFNRPAFLSLEPNHTYIIRILGGAPYEVATHWINGTYVTCLGEECPQCQQNKKIRMENPKDFRNIKGYSAVTMRAMDNVLDRTPVVVCPQCQRENYAVAGAYPKNCASCNALLINQSPVVSNKVKILSRGSSFFEAIETLDKNTLKEDTTPRGINNFDVVIYVSSNSKNAVPVAGTNYDIVEIPKESLFDLATIQLKFTADEMLQLMRGVSVRDIFTARRVTEGMDEISEVSTNEESNNAVINKLVDELFA